MDIILYQDLGIESGFNLNETLVFSLFKWFNNPLQLDEIFSYLKVISKEDIQDSFESLVAKNIVGYKDNFGFYLVKK